MAQGNAWADMVRERFRSGPPNGWLLGWDRERLFPEIARATAPSPIENLTSFDYSFCNRYEVRLGDEGGGFMTLAIRISFVADAFSLHWTAYEPGGRTGHAVHEAATVERAQIEGRVRTLLRAEGFQEIDVQELDVPIPDVELELAGAKATLGKCLFEDYEG